MFQVDAHAPRAREEEDNGSLVEGRLDNGLRDIEDEEKMNGEVARHDSIQEEGERRAVIEEQEREEMESEERERLAVAEGIRQSRIEHQRQQLILYEFGDKIHLASFRGLRRQDLDDVINIRLAMFGPAGSGKSCFINTCERVVLQKPKGTAPISATSEEGTTILEEYFHELPFTRLVDTRGQNEFDEFEIGEVKRILSGVIKPGDFIDRDPSHPQFEVGEDIPFGSLVHGVIFVVKATDVRLENEVLKRKLERFRNEGLQTQGLKIQPVTVVTHQDMLPREDDGERVKELASAATGSSPHCTFLLTNYCKENPDGNSETVTTTLTILHRALTVAEKFVKNAKLRMKSAQIDAVRRALDGHNGEGGPPESVRNASLSILFRDVLQLKHEWSNRQVDRALEVLEDRDVTTILALVICWDDIKPFLVELNENMAEIIERCLDRLNIEP